MQFLSIPIKKIKLYIALDKYLYQKKPRIVFEHRLEF